jgi:hypothetical protein
LAHGGTEPEAKASLRGMVGRARRLRLLASTAILLAALLPQNSLANDECGPAPSAVCDPGDTGYPFANGIIYDPVADLTLVVGTGAAIAPGSGTDGIFINSSAGNIDLTLADGASIATTGSFAEGILIHNHIQHHGQCHCNGLRHDHNLWKEGIRRLRRLQL